MPNPAISVTFLRDTPAMFQRALARPFTRADVPVVHVDSPPRATKAVGEDVGIVLAFLAGSAATGLAYEAEKQLVERAFNVLRGILAEAPFAARIQVREAVAVTEYFLPDGAESSRALDAYFVDQAAGRWRGERLRWAASEGWVSAEQDAARERAEDIVNIVGSLSSEDAAWVALQMKKRRDYEAQIAWVSRILNDELSRVEGLLEETPEPGPHSPP